MPVSMGLVTIIPKHLQVLWLMPIVFFSPPLIFLVLGGITGNRVARWRQARRTGE